MLDIKYLRENPKLVQKGAKDKGLDINIDEILKLDKKYTNLSISVQKLREERNANASNIKGKPTDEQVEKGKEIKQKLEKSESELSEKKEVLKQLLLKIPNPALKDVPLGNKDNFEIIKTEGKSPKFDFTPKDHLELGEALDIIDVQRASKVSGARFAYLKGDGALLEFALVQLALEVLTKEGFIPIIPPVLIKKENMQGLGYIEQGKDEMFTTENGELFLVGTAEQSIVPMHKDEILNKKELPKRYVGFSSSFRREAGSYGKDTKGILRVHQFDKVEIVEFVKPEDDEKERRKMLSLSESLLQKLELPYRVVKLTAEDIAFPSAETIDIETWMPSQNKYRETHSISTTTDFQSRRLNIKYIDGNEKKYVHILNGTAFAIGRTIIAILENFQNKDNSIDIPKVLHKYLPFSKIAPKK